MNRLRDSKPRLQPASAAALCLALGLAALSASGHPGEVGKPADPLAAEIAHWSSYLATHKAPASDENWPQIQAVAAPVIAAAEKALADGRRLLALQRLAAVRPMLAATVYVGEHTGAERKDEAAFEAEWQRMGRELQGDLGPTAPDAFEGVRPLAVRAVAETAMPQIRGYYDASLEFGKSTEPDSGLFYLGNARALRELAALCRTLSLPPGGAGAGAPPKLRPLAHELDDLETKLLAAYRPPASLDRHGDFITANSTLNEARQLDAAGLRAGALLRYLRRRCARIRCSPPHRRPLHRILPCSRKRCGASRDASPIRRSTTRSGVSFSRARRRISPPIRCPRNRLPQAPRPSRPTSSPATSPLSQTATARPVLPAPAVTVTLVRWPYT